MEICCEKCGGSGKVEIPKHLLETLSIFENVDFPLSVKNLLYLTEDVKDTTLHNRVKALTKMKLIEKSHKDGRDQFYKKT